MRGTANAVTKDMVLGFTLFTGLLLAGAEHATDASNWCWLINLGGVGMVALVAITTHRRMT